MKPRRGIIRISYSTEIKLYAEKLRLARETTPCRPSYSSPVQNLFCIYDECSTGGAFDPPTQRTINVHRQRKYWCKVVDILFSSLGLDEAEWLEDIPKGNCSL